jgi:hypothetical protein
MSRPSRIFGAGSAALLLATAGLGLGIGMAGPAQADSTFVAFEGAADSYAIGSSSRVPAALPLPIEYFLPRTRSNIDSQPHATGYAGVVDVPLGEVVSQFGVPSPLPNYCYAFFPGTPSADCGLQPLLPVALGEGVSGGEGKAYASGDPAAGTDGTSASGVATFSGYRSGAFQFSVGSARSESSSSIVEGVQQNVTEVVLQQVDIGGGALKFDQIRATATATTNGQPGGADAASVLTFSGVTVQGQPAPTPPELDLATLIRNLRPMADALKAAGVVLHAVDPPTIVRAKDGSNALADQSGFVVEMVDKKTGQGTTFTLAHARASAYAVPASASGTPASSVGSESRTPGVAPAGALPATAGLDGVDSALAPGATIPGSAVGATPWQSGLAVGVPAGVPAAAGAPAARYRPFLDPSLAAGSQDLQQRAVQRFSDLYLAGAFSALVLAGLAVLMGARRARP